MQQCNAKYAPRITRKKKRDSICNLWRSLNLTRTTIGPGLINILPVHLRN